jgi:hypothetical protein
MDTWAYSQLNNPTDEVLNTWGKAGWELVSVVTWPERRYGSTFEEWHRRAYLKRRTNDTHDPASPKA